MQWLAFKMTKSCAFPVITGYQFPICLLRAMRTHSSIILEINIDQMKILIEKNRIQVHILFLNKKKILRFILHFCHSVKKI